MYVFLILVQVWIDLVFGISAFVNYTAIAALFFKKYF